MKKFNKILFSFAYISNIALATGLWGMTENYWLKFLAVISPSFILGAINGHNSSKRARIISLLLGILGLCIFAYFVDISLNLEAMRKKNHLKF